MNRTPIRIALDLYDRHLPLFLGRVAPSEPYRFECLEVGMVPPREHGVGRHRRMLIDQEFDIAEVSLASFITARCHGQTDLVGIPIFPRRLFSQNHVFVAADADLHHPRDLRGRRVAIWAFQVTMSVLAKGDMQRDHGLDWREVHWMTENPEEIAHDYGADVSITRLPAGFDPLRALTEGQVDAYINPHPPEALMTPGNGVRRLFADPEAETRDYFERHGYFPIMHLLAAKPAVLDEHPGLVTELGRVFGQARAMARSWYTDPGFSLLMHARNLLEREAAAYAPQVWPDGIAANRVNLEDFIGYCLDQRLIARAPSPPELFIGDLG